MFCQFWRLRNGPQIFGSFRTTVSRFSNTRQPARLARSQAQAADVTSSVRGCKLQTYIFTYVFSYLVIIMDRLYFKEQKECASEIASCNFWKGIRLYDGDFKVCCSIFLLSNLKTKI